MVAIFLDSKAERVGIFLSAHLKQQKFWIPLNSESFHDLLTGLEIILYSMVTLSKSKFDYHGEWYDQRGLALYRDCSSKPCRTPMRLAVNFLN